MTALDAGTIGPTLSPDEHQTQLRRAVIASTCAVITLVATALMTDYTGRDISAEYQPQ